MNRFRLYTLLSLLLVSGCYTGTVSAQSINSLLFDNSGVQIGAFRGNTDFNEPGLNYSFRFINQHLFTSNRFGEISISIGSVSGLGYRSRVVPVEYRIAQRLRGLGLEDRNILGEKGSAYLYAGLGLLYNKPVEITAPEDPLTGEMGNGLPVSSFWDFKKGYAPFIPAGIGIDFELVNQARLSFNFGYNKTVTALRLNENPVTSGYWAATAGLNFRRQKPATLPPPPPPPPVIYPSPRKISDHTITEAPVEPMSLLRPLLEEMNREKIQFDVLSSQIIDRGREWVERMSKILRLVPELLIEIHGHADATGSEMVNEMISESRARAVWLAFVDNGIPADELKYSWHAARVQKQSNETAEGRLENRRVEFNLQEDETNEFHHTENTASVEYQPGEPVFHPTVLNFSWLELIDRSRSYEQLQQVASLLIENPELNLYVASVSGQKFSGSVYKELDKSRSEKLCAALIQFGAKASQVKAYNPYDSEIPEQLKNKLIRGMPQQTLLIPYKEKYHTPTGDIIETAGEGK